jgi:hypothetical protein
MKFLLALGRVGPVGALLTLSSGPAVAQAPSVHALTTEYRTNPVGTDTPRPRLSWKIVSATRNTGTGRLPGAGSPPKRPRWFPAGN